MALGKRVFFRGVFFMFHCSEGDLVFLFYYVRMFWLVGVLDLKSCGVEKFSLPSLLILTRDLSTAT